MTTENGKSIREEFIEELIEKNRLVYLPSTISKYTKIVKHKIHILENIEPWYSLSVKVWMPKIVEESMVEFIEEHVGLRANIISSSEYESLVEIIDLKKRDNLFGYEEYSKIRKKLISKNRKSKFRTVKNVPLIFARALVVDLTYFEGIDTMIIGEEYGDLWSKVDMMVL